MATPVEFTLNLSTKLNKDGIEKKVFSSMPDNWQQLTTSLINPSHNARGRITGKINNLTVFDFDDIESYKKFFKDTGLYEHDYFGAVSNRGIHLYFEYDADCKTGSDVMANYPGIDIRNDGGFITCPPTKYKLLNGSVFEYQWLDDMGQKIVPVPLEFKRNLKTEIAKAKKTEKSEKSKKNIPNNDTNSLLNNILPILKPLCENYEDWIKVGMALKHADKNNIDLFHEFSKMSNKYDEDECNKAWDNIKEKDNGLGVGSLIFYAKKIDPVKTDELLKKASHLPVNDESLNDVDETDYVLSCYPYWKKCYNELYCFDEHTGLWTTSVDTHLRVISEYARGRYKRFVSAMKNILSFIGSKCKDDGFLERNVNTSLGYLLFNNGYYDSKKQVFHENFNPEIVFFGKVNCDYVKGTEQEMNDIKKRFFYDPLNVVVGDYYIQILARGLMGDKMKKGIFGLGQTDCGKSTITKAVSRTFGEYIGTFNAGNFIKKDVNDDAQALRWALKLRYKRLIFSNEMDATKDLNGNEIKKLTGHDDLVGRGHCQDETSFNPHFLPIVFANDMPAIKPYDDALDNRVEVISYKKKFVDEPIDEFELKKDLNLNKEIETTKFQQNMASLFIWEYEKYLMNGALQRPEECQNAKKDWIEQDIGSLPAFLREFEITDDEKDKVASKEIDDWLKEAKLGITMKKFGMELKLHLERKKYEKVVNKVVSIGGKKLQVWVGIKRIE